MSKIALAVSILFVVFWAALYLPLTYHPVFETQYNNTLCRLEWRRSLPTWTVELYCNIYMKNKRVESCRIKNFDLKEDVHAQITNLSVTNQTIIINVKELGKFPKKKFPLEKNLNHSFSQILIKGREFK